MSGEEDLELEKKALEEELQVLRIREAEILKKKQLEDEIAQLKKDITKAKRNLEE